MTDFIVEDFQVKLHVASERLSVRECSNRSD